MSKASRVREGNLDTLSTLCQFLKILLEQSQWNLFISQDTPILHLNHTANIILNARLILKKIFSDRYRTVQHTLIVGGIWTHDLGNKNNAHRAKFI